MVDISLKYSLRSAVISSGCRRSVVSVEILDVGKEDRKFLAFRRYDHIHVPTEYAVVNLGERYFESLPEIVARKLLDCASAPFMPRMMEA